MNITTASEIPMEQKRHEQEEINAFKFVRSLRGFYMHALQYVLIVAALWVLNLITQPRHLWVLWVTAGWGLGLFFHALRVFQPSRLFGPEWERVQVERRLGRPL